jgi:hypothetical protein
LGVEQRCRHGEEQREEHHHRVGRLGDDLGHCCHWVARRGWIWNLILDTDRFGLGIGWDGMEWLHVLEMYLLLDPFYGVPVK